MTTQQELKKAVHNQCSKDVFTAWLKDSQSKWIFYDDEKGTTIHNCPKKPYQGKKQRTKEEVDRIANEALQIALKVVDSYNGLSNDDKSRQIAIACIFKGCVELYK